MSHLSEQESPCTYCQYPNQVEVWSIINVNTDPELRDLLLGGELNIAECSSCKEFFYAEHFLLYHDPAYELMAFVYPHAYAEEKSSWEQKTEVDFQKSQENVPEKERYNYKPVTIFGLDHLVFLVEDEEEASIQGDIACLLAADHGFQVKKIRPSQARELQVPPVIPFFPSQSDLNRQSIVAGVEKLLAANDRLFVYQKFLEKLKANPDWQWVQMP